MRRSPMATLALRGGALVFCMGGIALLIAQFRGRPAAPPSGAPASDSAAENRSQARLPLADSTEPDSRNPGRRQTNLAPPGSESRGMIQLVNVDVSLVLEMYQSLSNAELSIQPEALRNRRVTIRADRDLSAAEAAQLIECELRRQSGLKLVHLDGKRVSVEPGSSDPRHPLGCRFVRCSVRALDQATGQPLAQFRVLLHENSEKRPRDLGAGRDGFVEWTQLCCNSVEYAVEVSSGGYLPWATPPVKGGIEPQSILVRLVSAGAYSGQVFLPDGRPADGADVFVASKLFHPSMGSDGSFFLPRRHAKKRFRTDTQGHFSFEPIAEAEYVVIAHDSGCATIRLPELDGRPVLLQKWARVEGRLLFTQAPIAAQSINVFPDSSREEPRISYSTSVETDSDGRFVLPRIPPGLYRISRSTSMAWTPGVREATHTITVWIEPGTTNQVALLDSHELVTLPVDLVEPDSVRIAGSEPAVTVSFTFNKNSGVTSTAPFLNKRVRLLLRAKPVSRFVAEAGLPSTSPATDDSATTGPGLVLTFRENSQATTAAAFLRGSPP